MKTIQTMLEVPTSDIMIIREGNLLRLFFGFTPFIPIKGEAKDLYNCENIDVQGSSYASIVNAIMVDKYPSDKVQAVLLNYQDALNATAEMTDEKRAEYIAEYNDMQDYRKFAKEIARKCE